jgi:hypothetical protein
MDRIDIERLKERHEKLPIRFQGMLYDCYNTWLGVANLARGIFTPEQIYKEVDEVKGDYRLASTWPCDPERLPETERDLAIEHFAELEILVDEVNQMALNKNIDVERVKVIYDLALAMIYGRKK